MATIKFVDAITPASEVADAYRARREYEGRLRDMATTIVANARALVRALGYDPKCNVAIEAVLVAVAEDVGRGEST